MRWLKDAKLHVAVLGGILLLAQVLVACQEPGSGATPLPGAQEVGETSNGSIEVWEDPERDVVCYAWDGYETDGFSCVLVRPTVP